LARGLGRGISRGNGWRSKLLATGSGFPPGVPGLALAESALISTCIFRFVDLVQPLPGRFAFTFVIFTSRRPIVRLSILAVRRLLSFNYQGCSPFLLLNLYGSKVSARRPQQRSLPPSGTAQRSRTAATSLARIGLVPQQSGGYCTTLMGISKRGSRRLSYSNPRIRS
jgi:hypothetical protein